MTDDQRVYNYCLDLVGDLPDTIPEMLLKIAGVLGIAVFVLMVLYGTYLNHLTARAEERARAERLHSAARQQKINEIEQELGIPLTRWDG